MWVVLTVCMLVVALVFSMLGQGGGALYTPLQVWFGVEFHQAATTSLFLIVVTALSASLVFYKARMIDWPLAIVLEMVTATGGFAGGVGSRWFSGAVLSLVYAAVVAAAAIFMLRPMIRRQARPDDFGTLLSWKRTLGRRIYRVNLALALPLSFAAGILSGLVGVGGGLINVPMMVVVLGIPMEIAVGSSALMVGLTAGGGLAGHLTSAPWDWRLAPILAPVVFLGGQIGSRLTVGLNKTKLKKGLGWFLLVIAGMMLFKALNPTDRNRSTHVTPAGPRLAPRSRRRPLQTRTRATLYHAALRRCAERALAVTAVQDSAAADGARRTLVIRRTGSRLPLPGAGHGRGVGTMTKTRWTLRLHKRTSP
ncbi:MAG: sulfite exporter TauE/SafE family protein [Planctomycetes bacterium]|nr:sulfite exporter TauE/SafE family protein [Planctomycetota bacterium]